MLSVAWAITATAALQVAPQVVVVRPAAWQAEVAPWVEFRRQQGWRVECRDAPADESALRTLVGRGVDAGVEYFILVGDASPDSAEAACPTAIEPMAASLRFGGAATAASDSALADVDADGFADACVARWPFDQPEQAARYVQRVLERESASAAGAWRRRIGVAAAPGGFGPLLDAVIENSARQVLAECIPADRCLDVLYARPNGRACPQLDRIPQSIHRQFAQGCQFWLYVGHGSERSLAPLLTRRRRYPVFEREHAAAMPRGANRSVAFLLTCLAGSHADRDDCLVEEMLAAEHGPAAVLAGSGVTMPYGMAVFGYELTRAAFVDRARTLGAAVHQARRGLVEERDDSMRRGLDTVYAAAGFGRTARSLERRDHAKLFHLFGDPLLSIASPAPLQLAAPEQATAGARLTVRCLGESPGAGRLELCLPRSRFEQWRAVRDDGAEKTRDEERDVVAFAEFTPEQAGRWRATLAVPADASGAYLLRGSIDGDGGFASGARAIQIVPAS